MREACLLALRVAAEGEVAEPRIPSPAAIRPLFGFTRLSSGAYGRIRGAVDDDPGFRERVAAVADESVVGRAGWLWLTRPEGWEADPAFTEVPAGRPPAKRSASARSGVDAKRDGKLVRAREQAERADEARRRAQEQRTEALAELDQVRAELEEVAARVAGLEAERNAAIRTQKALEADLAAVRRDLKLAREATRQAEAELLANSSGPAAPAPPNRAEPPTPTPGGSPAEPAIAPTAEPGIDAEGARSAVSAAAAAAAELARALAATAAALGPASTEVASPQTSESGDAHRGTSRRGGKRDRRSGRRRRRSPSLPPGLIADSPEARRHLVGDPGVAVVVDGYNLAREAWSGITPEEERRRTVVLLEEVAHRSGAPVTVVFDGDSTAVAPAASRVVRVRFSASGTTADHDIAALLATIPIEQPVLVVSTDREVADDARAQGAAVLTSAEYLAAIGR